MRRPGVGAGRRGALRAGLGGSVLLAPANTVAPVISGTRGGTLSCTTGTWAGVPAPTYAYQWQSGATIGGGGSWANIGGATASTFDDSGTSPITSPYDVRCVVTATNAAGSAAANSNTLAAWTPLSFSDVLGFYSAANAASLTIVSGEATTWNDLGPRANHMSASAADSAVYPAYEATGLGGPCLLFDGVGEWLRDAAVSFGGTLGSYTLAACMDQVAMGANQYCAALGATGRPSLIQRTNQLRHTGSGGVAQNSTTNPTTAGLWIADWDGANQNLYLNTTLEVGPTVNANAALADGAQFSVGSLAGASFANCRIGMVLIIRGVATGAQRSLLRNYCTAIGWP